VTPPDLFGGQADIRLRKEAKQMIPIDASAVAELVKRLRHQSEEAYFAGYCDDADHLTEVATLLEQQSARLQELEALLVRSRVFVAYDAQMMADITRFSPLEAASQALHDSTETESEKLLPLIDVALAADAAGEKHD